jgi:ribosome-associated protein
VLQWLSRATQNGHTHWFTSVTATVIRSAAPFSCYVAGRTMGAVGEPEQVKVEANIAGDADDALRFAADVARIADENKTEDVAVLDLRGLSNLTDFFVIGTGTSDRQMHAVVDLIEEHAKAVGRSPFKVADTRKADWILADYVDVVIHLFDARHRDYYDLDGLWGDAPQIDWRLPAAQGLPRPTE